MEPKTYEGSELMDPYEQFSEAFDELGERLERLERVVNKLTQFIPREQRSDLKQKAKVKRGVGVWALFLILDQYLTEFNLRLKRVTERKEMKTLLLTSAQITLNLALVFCLSEQDASICNIRTQPSKPSI